MPVTQDFLDFLNTAKPSAAGADSVLLSEEELGISEDVIDEGIEERLVEEKPALTRGEELKQEAIELAEQAEEQEGFEKVKTTAKGVAKTIPAAGRRLFESSLEGFGDLGALIGTYTSGVDLTDEERAQILEEMEIEKQTPEAKESLSKKAEVALGAATLGVPAVGASKIPQIAPKTLETIRKVSPTAAKLVQGVRGAGTAGVAGIEAGGVFTIATEGELPSIRESGINAAIGVGAVGAGNLLKNVGGKVFKSAFAANTKEAELLQDFAVGRLKESPRTKAVTALEKGLIGTEKQIGIKAGKVGDKLGKEVTGFLNKSDEVITGDELLIPVLDEISSIPEGVRRNQLLKGFEAFIEANPNLLTGSISLKEAQALKRELAKHLPQKAFRGEEVGAALNEVKNKVSKNIRTLTYNKLAEEGAKQKYLDWSNLIQLEDLSKNVFKKKGFKAGPAELAGSIWNAVTTPIQTVGGKTIYEVGGVLIEGPAGAVKLSDILEQQGLIEKDIEDFVKESDIAK
jgi:hypothetical protein